MTVNPPIVDIFERMRLDAEYAMTVADYIKRTHPDRMLEWVEDNTKVSASGPIHDIETEVEWA